MTVKIKVYSDYVCPFCFLAEKPLVEAIEGKDVEVEWMPYELRPYPNETLKPEGHYLQSTWKQSIYPMAERMGIDIILPKVSPQPYTHLAFEGYQYAKEKDKGNEYNDRMLRAFFQEEQDIGNINILTKLAGEIGLNDLRLKLQRLQPFGPDRLGRQAVDRQVNLYGHRIYVTVWTEAALDHHP